MTRNAKVGEYIILNTGEEVLVKSLNEESVYGLGVGTGLLWTVFHGDYTLVEDTIERKAKLGDLVTVSDEEGTYTVMLLLENGEGVQLHNGWKIQHGYYKVEDTMKAEDIDLSVDQVFEAGEKVWVYNDNKGDFVKYERIYLFTHPNGLFYCVDETEESEFEDGGDPCMSGWNYMSKVIAKPEPKTRPMTNLEVFQLMPIGTVLYLHEHGEILSAWKGEYAEDTPQMKYTIIDQAFKDLKGIDDIEWKKMEVKE